MDQKKKKKKIQISETFSLFYCINSIIEYLLNLLPIIDSRKIIMYYKFFFCFFEIIFCLYILYIYKQLLNTDVNFLFLRRFYKKKNCIHLKIIFSKITIYISHNKNSFSLNNWKIIKKNSERMILFKIFKNIFFTLFFSIPSFFYHSPIPIV